MFDWDINGESYVDSYMAYQDDPPENYSRGPSRAGNNFKETKYVKVECDVEKETERAYLVKVGGGEPFWLPKSQCKKTKGGIEIPEWLYNKKEIY